MHVWESPGQDLLPSADSWLGCDRIMPVKLTVKELTRAEREGRAHRGRALPAEKAEKTEKAEIAEDKAESDAEADEEDSEEEGKLSK